MYITTVLKLCLENSNHHALSVIDINTRLLSTYHFTYVSGRGLRLDFSLALIDWDLLWWDVAWLHSNGLPPSTIWPLTSRDVCISILVIHYIFSLKSCLSNTLSSHNISVASKLAQVHGGIRLLYYDKGTQFGVNFDPFGATVQRSTAACY